MRTLTVLAGWFAATVLLATPALADPAPPQAWVADIAAYERDAWSREPTACDTLAAHPDDPERVSECVPQQAVDVDAAIAACTAAVAADPGNPRLNYQLARAYGYAGRHAEGEAARRTAVLSGYPQSLFVIGYIMVTGWDGAEPDPCTAAELILRSARAGRKAGLIGFPHYVVNGAFAGCPVTIDRAELLGFLEAAEPRGYYEGLLVENLRARVQAAP